MLTLKLGATEVNYPAQTTDYSGFFTSSVSLLPPGTYTWRAKGPQYLAITGTVALAGAPVTPAELGLLRVGDANNDNVVEIGDFGLLQASFGRAVGDPGYDARADFNGDEVVGITDFSLLLGNFGQAGAPPLGMVAPAAPASRPSTGFMELRPQGGAPGNGGTVRVGETLTLDLWVQPGPLDQVVAHQSYLTFPADLLQNVELVAPGRDARVRTTITGDGRVFATVLQNEVCNGPGPCRFRGITTPPGSIAFASAALQNLPIRAPVRVGQIALRAVAPGAARLHWQGGPPDPPHRHTRLINQGADQSSSTPLLTDYVVQIVQ
jgi:hypothetical protein